MALATLSPQLNATTLAQLNFSQTCSNSHLAVQIYNHFFYDGRDQPLNSSAYNRSNPYNDGPASFESWWNDGPPPEWIDFWRTELKTKPQLSPDLLTDDQVAVWANSSDAFGFFWIEAYPSITDWYTNDIALYGGCVNNKTLSLQDLSAASYGGYDFNNLIEDCMVLYCCPITLDSNLLSASNTPYPYMANWTTAATCAFHTCQAATQGNPDLAGIGIIVAYYIEAALLIGTCGMAFLELFVTASRAWRLTLQPRHPSSVWSRFWGRHEMAHLSASTVFLDAAVYFSLSVSFAGIWFNYRDKPLLYEDKIGQTSTLLAVNAPVVILMLIYTRSTFERPQLRYSLVAVASLMALIIQFMFRRTDSLDSNSPLCVVWTKDLNQLFDHRFIIKAVWAGLVVIFFGSHLVPWLFPRGARRVDEALKRFGHKGRRSSSKLLSPSYFTRFIYLIFVLRRRILAIFLAAYGIFDTFYDIGFIRMLRDREVAVAAQAEVAANNDQDNWGYGQILAVLIWIPIFVEYLYVVIRGPEESEEDRRQSTADTLAEETKYVGVSGHGHEQEHEQEHGHEASANEASDSPFVLDRFPFE